MEEGDYQTATPSGLPHVPTLLAALLDESERAGETGWAILCSSHVRQIRTRSERRKLGAGDWAWGCGYRNLQMLFSAIQARPAYQHILARHPLLRSLSHLDSTHLAIPSILHWQRIIQDAWLSGFDPPGAAHFDQRLVGKKSWIGTTEVYVALSRLGLRCQIVDFPHPTGPNAQHVKLFQWVEKEDDEGRLISMRRDRIDGGKSSRDKEDRTFAVIPAARGAQPDDNRDRGGRVRRGTAAADTRPGQEGGGPVAKGRGADRRHDLVLPGAARLRQLDSSLALQPAAPRPVSPSETAGSTPAFAGGTKQEKAVPNLHRISLTSM
ncbi:hypothetical protein VP01_453g22 [Puccinia sorghi]|uniref:UFSP1/2/DUB catalytic domain-containing protein n=1 Tax=Puccinia sorghi TaxID=27349 RepID=A0A0L6UQW9_9BASI|nr:hypothetical protein VP01_453g22 [Puccinia sorghi]